MYSYLRVFGFSLLWLKQRFDFIGVDSHLLIGRVLKRDFFDSLSRLTILSSGLYQTGFDVFCVGSFRISAIGTVLKWVIVKLCEYARCEYVFNPKETLSECLVNVWIFDYVTVIDSKPNLLIEASKMRQ